MSTKNIQQMPEKTFKISQLKEITNLDDEDLFIVSDYENNKCYTKKITKKALMDAFINNPDLIQLIMDQQGELDEQIQKKVDDKVEEAFIINTIDGGNATE